MLRWMIAKFEREFNYDASYARDVIEHAPVGMVWLLLAARIVRKPKARVRREQSVGP